MGFNKLNLGAKISVIFCVVFTLIFFVLTCDFIHSFKKNERIEIRSFKKQILDNKKKELLNITLPPLTFIENNKDKINVNIKKIVTYVYTMNYGKNNKGRYYVVNSNGDLLYTDTKNNYLDRYIFEKKDINGKNVFKELITLTKTKEEGQYLTYMHKEAGNYTSSKILSFCKKVKGKDMYLIVRLNIDDITQRIFEKETILHTKFKKEILHEILIAIGFLIFALICSYLLVRYFIVRPINFIIGTLHDISNGDGDLTQIIEKKNLPDCSQIIHCNQQNCRSFGKKVECWAISASFAFNPDCPKISEGEYDSCEECVVYQKFVVNDIDKLAIYVNAFVYRVKETISSVINDNIVLIEVISELVELSKNINVQLTSTEIKTKSIYEEIASMTIDIHSVAASIEQSSQATNMIATSSEEMTSTITEISQNTENAKEMTEEAVIHADDVSKKMSELKTSTILIEKFLGIIADISDQVNLLALNATIEAARAGEAGKGFAVIANEVKELAGQTSNAAEEISNVLTTVRSNTDGTNTAVQEVTKNIKEVNEIVFMIAAAIVEQSTTSNEISKNVIENSSGIAEISNNINDVTSIVKGIHSNTDEVSKAITFVLNGSSELNENVSRLNSLGEQLSMVINRFKV